MSLQIKIEQRGISEVLHFSTNRGVIGVLHSRHLLSRPLLNENAYLRHVLQLNASVRPEESEYFDKSEDWIRFINLSISEINKRFLDVSRKWHNNVDVWWCILAFDPLIMKHDGVRFATTNNGYDQCRRGQSEEGFDALFAPTIRRKASGYNGQPWSVSRQRRPNNLTTCEQAEVLYPEKLSLDYLRTVYVEEDEHHDVVMGWLRDFNYDNIDVVVKPEKFVGRRN
ncbi:DarT ssDNA thymidine ADP-ribosyltransferase family protein [Paraglaciecola sp.]|uniref:DarT ssDNA thymidine ADP-ribosyltransferase family protein n=1 Tax=Paraglaciecola sp. TaxID=1920173 RepID=UPI00326600E9